MQITGNFHVPAPRARVWDALNDPEILRQCIPGCESLTRLSDNEFEGKVVSKIGPVKATFTGKVTLSDIDPPNGYTISGEGKGGVAGFAKGGAKVSLKDSDGGTTLDYVVDASVGGKIAQLGGRLIEATVAKTSEDFFGRFTEILTSGPRSAIAEEIISEAPPAATPPPAAESAPVAPPPAPAVSSKSGAWKWWVVAGVIVVALIVWQVMS
jgi:carbon monoxide dehydrogenase subunit G